MHHGKERAIVLGLIMAASFWVLMGGLPISSTSLQMEYIEEQINNKADLSSTQHLIEAVATTSPAEPAAPPQEPSAIPPLNEEMQEKVTEPAMDAFEEPNSHWDPLKGFHHFEQFVLKHLRIPPITAIQ